MIILIGGVGCAGKTLMAQKLLETYHIPYLSIDHLKMGLFRADPKGCGFTPESSQAVIGERLWPILKGMIMTQVENRQSHIIEGCYLLPRRVAELEAFYRARVLSLYLGFSEGYIRQHYHGGILGHRCAIEARQYEEGEDIDAYILANARQKALCAECGAPYFEIRRDYPAEMAAVYAWVDRQVAQLGQEN